MKITYKIPVLIFQLLIIILSTIFLLYSNAYSQSSNTKERNDNQNVSIMNVSIQKNILIISAIICIVGMILILIPWAIFILFEKFSRSEQLKLNPTENKDNIDLNKFITPIKSAGSIGKKVVKDLIEKNTKKVISATEKNKFVEP